MLRLRIEARTGLRWGVCSLATMIALLAVSSDPADARTRRKKAGARTSQAASYQPAYAAIVVDANTGNVLHAASADALRHPASLTKIMTLYMLFERLESGKLKLDSPLADIRTRGRAITHQARAAGRLDDHGRGRHRGHGDPLGQ